MLNYLILQDCYPAIVGQAANEAELYTADAKKIAFHSTFKI